MPLEPTHGVYPVHLGVMLEGALVNAKSCICSIA